MPRLSRKTLSFQAGELSPRFFGRSDTEIYAKGLAIAENVTIDKRGGAFKRGGLEHLGRIDANTARLFTLQVSRIRYYTIIVFYDLLLDKGQMLIAAPGASVVGSNLLVNGNFGSLGLNWSVAVEPASSLVLFNLGECILRPEQNDVELVDNGSFLQEGLGWIVRESHAQSSVNFFVGSCELIPHDIVAEFAGISQQLETNSPGEPHFFKIEGEWASNVLHVRFGIAEADGTDYDEELINSQAGQIIEFTPAASPFWITVDSVFPNSHALLTDITVLDTIAKTSQISQQATVIAAQSDEHLVIVGQAGVQRLHVLIGTTEGASDILAVDSTDHEIIAEFVPNNPVYWVSVLADGDEVVEARLNFVGTAAEELIDPNGLLMDAPWIESQLSELHSIEVPSGKTLYFTHPNVPVQKIIYDHASDVFTPLAEVSFTAPPPQWADQNHPATGAHFQGRLWLGGTPGEQQTLWASRSGSPEDFTVESEQADSALEFTLQEFGRIEWMLGTKNLLIGAENGEHILSSEAGVITPTDFKIEQQSSYGSNNMQAVQVGEKVFYLTPDGRKLRAMSYEWQENNWLSQDLTFASEHITEGIGKHSCWAQNPDALFMMVLRDGTISVLTYDRTGDTVAWSHIITPGMTIKDVATGRRDGINEIVAVGQRVAGKIDIESNSSVNQMLDSLVGVFDAGGTNIITGLDHLEGLPVRPIVDGAVNPIQVVIGGQITTQQTGRQLYAGIPYTATIKTMPPDVPQDQIRSWKKRWNKVWALMYQSKQPIINGVRPPERSPSTPMNTVEPDSSLHYKTVSLGWDDFGQVTISEDLPVNMNVLAIYGEMAAEEI